MAAMATLPDLGQVAKGCAAGGFAAAITKTTLAPVDRVKLILQLQNATTSSLALSEQPQIRTSRNRYIGTVDCLRKLRAEQGLASLWRGNSASIARCFPNYALNLAFRDYFRHLFNAHKRRQESYGKFIASNVAAGGSAGAMTLCVCYPLDFARTRLALEMSGKSNGVFTCLRSIYSKEGVPGWYRGFFISLNFVVASRAIFFGLFDTLKATCQDYKRETKEVSPQLSFICTFILAQLCITASGLCTYPMDTVRRKLMLQSGKSEKQYSSSLDCYSKILKADGVNGLFRGVCANSLKTTSGALVLAVYYELMKWF